MIAIEVSAYRAAGISFYKDTVKIVLHPRDFYETMTGEKDQRAAVIFLCICAGIYSIAATFFALENHATYFFLMLANGMLYPVVTAASLHLVLWASGSTKSGFSTTFRIVAYANVVLLLAWIPGLAPFAEIFKYYLVGMGLIKTVEISWIKAVAVILGTLGILLLFLHLARIFITGSL